MALPNEGGTVAVAGASGFIGRALGARLAGTHHRIALTRGQACSNYDEARPCDLFSLRDAEQGLEGARYAVYLVHSMMPSAKLVQGSFPDLDLICADNFARGAKKAGVEQIVYVGGIIPDVPDLSPHLQSRREVGRALAGHGTPVTALRAGLVVGSGGSSLTMMRRLVERLPFMVTPRWTASRCQPIALSDLIELLAYVIGRPECFGETYDVGGSDVLSYREMMAVTAERLGLQRSMLPIPILSPGLSTLWVSLITGTSRKLVKPLVQSLEHDMVASDRRLQDAAGIRGKNFREALDESLAGERAERVERGTQLPAAQTQRAPSAPAARSVQRLPLPRGKDAVWVADEYLRWLPALRAVRVGKNGARGARLFTVGVEHPLLELTFSEERSTPDRQLFYVTGGVLARAIGRGRLEFRETGDHRTVLAAVHDFHPRLPWPLYALTQATLHLWVMNAFGSHLRRTAAELEIAHRHREPSVPRPAPSAAAPPAET